MIDTSGQPEAPAPAGSLRRAVHGLTRLWTDGQIRSCVVAGLVAFLVYEITQEPGTQVFNQYVRLADAMLHGRLDIAEKGAWLELVIFEGRAYSHQGLLPAILIMPFVLLFGLDFNMRHFAALLGGGISMAAWSLATRIGLDGWRRIAGWTLPVLGTTLWFEAKVGTSWGIAALGSALFLFLALNEHFGRRRLWLVGLLVGIAALSRPPAILTLVGFALAVREPRKIVRLGLGAALPVAVILGYNVARFGTLTDKALELHYANDAYRLQRPPGLFSVAHVPFNLYSWFLMGPAFQAEYPFVRPTIMGTALPLTSPALLTAFGARRERWMWISAILVAMPAALLYANGFSQFGMRYLLDAVPFLAALVFVALKDGRAGGYLALLAAAIAFNAYGVFYTTVFGLKP